MANTGKKVTVEHSGESASRKTNGVSALARRRGGPRTVAGKRRSRLNAVTHGIFSTVVVLDEESQEAYESVHRGLWNEYLPVEETEEILVEKLAMLAWRHRRLLIAERGEILKHSRILQVDRRNQQTEDAEKIISKAADKPKELPEALFNEDEGLVIHADNPDIADKMLKLLKDLRTQVENFGLSSAENWSILTRIYGRYGRDHICKTLFDRFDGWIATAEVSEEERARLGWPTPEQCKEYFLKCIDAEILRVEKFKEGTAAFEEYRADVERDRQQVPDSPSLDRLVRYEAHIDRLFARTLDQLERIQRMRLGQPVPPPLKVEVSKN